MTQAQVPARKPFERGSISFRLYPHSDLDAPGVVEELCAQGRLALEGGFDGVMTSEHHGGVGGYIPNPLQMAAFILEETAAGWAAACPLLLPLRPTALVAEEVAWLAARHPGRVGVGVGSGALALDFEAMGLDVSDAPARFKAELPRIVKMLRGEDLGELEGDRALADCGDRPVPVLSAAVSVAAARRAAVSGAGLILEGMSDRVRLSELCAAYAAAGGTMPRIVIRRVWLGAPQSDLVEKQRRFYQSAGGETRRFPPDQTIFADDGSELADALVDLLRSVGGDGLNLRVHLPGMAPGMVREQIARLAADVLPVLRGAL
jgi:alkanesulfonate monooxygenase SsuD/methylene tetrahydromethanopterin reductase-like flavin-dependent oxidoreductase (luciferase family)